MKPGTFFRSIRFSKTTAILVGILLIAAILRFWRINEYMTFLGDEGRDVLVVKRMIVDHKFTLLGPITSVGSIYMGPIYYYMMTPFLWLWNFDPVGPSIMVALFAVATVYGVYRIGKDFFQPSIGLIAAFLYATSPLTVLYGRSSWNPNVVPFFAVGLMYGLLQVVVRRKAKWLVLCGFCLGILIQLHYVTLLFIPVILSCLVLIKFSVPRKYYALAFAAFLVAYSPFLLFEIRHGFVNVSGAMRFMTQQSSEGQRTLGTFLHTVSDVSVRVFWRLVIVVNAEVTKLFLVVFAGVIYALVRKGKDIVFQKALLVLMLWLVVGIISYGLYQGVIYDYYFGSLYAVPFLLTGVIVWYLFRLSRYTRAVAVVLLLLIFASHVWKSPLRIEPNNLLANTKTIAQFVSEKTNGKRYNFALIAGKNSDHAYRYFLETWGNAPVVIENPAIDPNRTTVMPELWIVCEEKECKPLGHPLWEIAGYGPADIAGEWKVSTARIFQLVPVINQPIHTNQQIN